MSLVMEESIDTFYEMLEKEIDLKELEECILLLKNKLFEMCDDEEEFNCIQEYYDNINLESNVQNS